MSYYIQSRPSSIANFDTVEAWDLAVATRDIIQFLQYTAGNVVSHLGPTSCLCSLASAMRHLQAQSQGCGSDEGGVENIG